MFQPPRSIEKKHFLPTRKRAITFCVSVVVALALFAAGFPLVYLTANALIPDCVLDSVFGLRCPLCGGTRCIKALVLMDITQAVYYNPLVVAASLMLVYVFARIVISCFVREYKPYRMKLFDYNCTPWVMLVIYLSFMLVRNLPFYRAILY